MRYGSVFLRCSVLFPLLLLALLGRERAPHSDNPGTREGPAQRGQGAAPQRGPADTPPNVLLHVVDTLRAGSLGCYGHPVVQTPAVDRFARQGTLFENPIARSFWTRPSVGSILTALYPAVHGVQGRDDRLPQSPVLLSERLKQHGYATCCITTNPDTGSFVGLDQNFDEFLELCGGEEAGFVEATELTTAGDTAVRIARRTAQRDRSVPGAKRRVARQAH